MNLKQSVSILLCVLLLIAWGSSALKLKVANNKLEGLIAQVDTLNAQITQQNLNIEQWKSASEKQRLKISTSQRIADARNLEAEKQVEDVLTSPIPEGCQNAINAGISEAIKLKNQ